VAAAPGLGRQVAQHQHKYEEEEGTAEHCGDLPADCARIGAWHVHAENAEKGAANACGNLQKYRAWVGAWIVHASILHQMCLFLLN